MVAKQCTNGTIMQCIFYINNASDCHREKCRQVIPDITYWTQEGGEKVSEEDQEYMANYQSYFFSEPAATLKRSQPKKKRATGPKLPAPAKALRQSAYHEMRALDKVLTTMLGLGLVFFLHTDDEDGVRDRDDFYPTLVLHFDEASQGFAMIWYLLYALPMRIVPVRDVFHREWNDARLALSGSQLWWVVLITTIVVNLPFGPWEGGTWWERMVSQAADMSVRSSSDSPLFTILYELIARDLGETATGTSQHMKTIFSEMVYGNIFQKKGEKVALRRWFSWVAGIDSLDCRWNNWLCTLINIGLSKGYYKTYQDVPMWKGNLRPLPAGDDDDDDDDNADVEGHDPISDEMRQQQQDDRDKKQAEAATAAASSSTAKVPSEDKATTQSTKDEVAALRKKCLNTMYVCVAVLCKPGLQDLSRMVATIIRPIWSEHSDNARTVRGMDGARSFYIRASQGHVFTVLEAVCRTCQDVSALGRMGFDTEFSTVDVKRTLTTDPNVQSESVQAEQMASGIIHMLRHRIGAMLWHLSHWPGLLPLFLVDDFSPTHKVITMLRDDILAFVKATEKAQGSAFIGKLVKCNPMNTQVMKDITKLLFTDDHVLITGNIAKVQRYVWELFSGWGNTKMLEDNLK